MLGHKANLKPQITKLIETISSAYKGKLEIKKIYISKELKDQRRNDNKNNNIYH